MRSIHKTKDNSNNDLKVGLNDRMKKKETD